MLTRSGSDFEIVDPRIVFERYRCDDCGRFFGIERSVPAACPRCASFEVSEREKEIAQLKRRIASLKGAAKRRSK